MKTVSTATPEIVVGDILRMPIGQNLYHLVEYVSLGDQNDIQFVCDTGRINVTRDDFVYRLAHSESAIRDSHAVVSRGDKVRDIQFAKSPATELGEYLKIANDSGLRVTVDSKFGNDNYTSVVGSWPALQRFASNVLTRFVRHSTVSEFRDLRTNGLIEKKLTEIYLDVDVQKVMKHIPDNYKAVVSPEAAGAVLVALKASFGSGDSTATYQD